MLSMKNILVVLFILFFIAGVSLSQEYNYGFSVGYNRTIPQFNKEQNYQDINPKNYFNVMGFLEVRGNPNSRVQVGLKYFKIGYSSEYKPDFSVVYILPPPISSGSTLSYLAFPIDLNYSSHLSY